MHKMVIICMKFLYVFSKKKSKLKHKTKEYYCISLYEEENLKI